MEIDICPQCGGRHFRGRPCLCESGPVTQLANVIPSRPASTRKVREWAKSAGRQILGALIIVVVVPAIIMGIVYGISSERLKHSPARSGETSAEYAQMLQDPQSAQALLDLVNSRPGYDLYTIRYLDPMGGVETFSYEFSTDTVRYVPAYFEEGEQPLSWEGHGIKRLEREAQGGSL